MTSTWDEGKEVSIKFYSSKVFRKAEQFNHKHYLPLYFDTMIGEKTYVKVADVGAGMFSTIGTMWFNGEKQVDIEVFPSDLLADTYNKILKEKNIIPLTPVEKQDMENLTYADNFFDIVHCVNAIDHCTNPARAIYEMVRVCKPGGWVYLRHYTNTATEQAHSGLHQWDIVATYNEKDCLFKGKNEEFLLSKGYPFKTRLGREFGYEPRNMVISMMQKPL